LSVGEHHTVYCCWFKEVNCPPWIHLILRVCTLRDTAPKPCRTTTVVSHTRETTLSHAALKRWFIQCGVVRGHVWFTYTVYITTQMLKFRDQTGPETLRGLAVGIDDMCSVLFSARRPEFWLQLRSGVQNLGLRRSRGQNIDLCRGVFGFKCLVSVSISRSRSSSLLSRLTSRLRWRCDTVSGHSTWGNVPSSNVRHHPKLRSDWSNRYRDMTTYRFLLFTRTTPR